MSWLAFAVQNTLRNRRRSLVTVAIAALGTAAILLAGGRSVTDKDILAVLEESGGNDRPQVEVVNWDGVVLPGPVVSDIKAILRELKKDTKGTDLESLRPQAPHAAISGEPHAKFTSIAFMG